MKTILVTGGAGFIGSAFVLGSIANGSDRIVTIDKLSYAGSLANLASLEGNDRHVFVRGDVQDYKLVSDLLEDRQPDAIVHFAAETHVDRSIDGPTTFLKSNVVGTFALIEATRAYLAKIDKPGFRFMHVSTDEVFGSLPLGVEDRFHEGSPYAPRSPYSASKAAADHFVRAYHHTYGLPAIVTNCSNNYGPRQLPEKIVPLMILNCVEGKPLPIYGNGSHVRDWIHVEDHCAGIRLALDRGVPGETYLFGGRHAISNLELVRIIADTVDQEIGRSVGKSRDLITFVADRPGHDQRYDIDPSKSDRDLGWTRAHNFASGIRETVSWYLANPSWREGISRDRLGLRSEKTTSA